MGRLASKCVVTCGKTVFLAHTSLFLRDGTLLTSFTWKIKFLTVKWYTQDHKVLRRILDYGKELGMPDRVLINGKGPYKYNSSILDAIDYLTTHVELDTKSSSITLSHEMDDSSHVGKTFKSLKVALFTFSAILNFSTTLL
ncbi:hypothetical protein N665_0178s0023 [Sinapis alba]|nr:hypothetical protein N665_2550s0004 [Sinapis alba]KAF8104139.1 hypothetical protein N665_0178s0023 [Sinapis alba]